MKIGVITEYYNNRNYGGQLQAFALIMVLKKMGCEAEQICFDRRLQKAVPSLRHQLRKVFHKGGIFKSYQKLACSIEKRKISKELIWREEAFESFQKKIPHTVSVYNSSTINQIANAYDCFICGSDQIWQVQNICPEYFLEFVSDDVYKYAFSASMPDIKMNDEQRNYVYEQLRRFNRISVREKITADVLRDILQTDVKWTVDPTMLLSKNEWENYCDRTVMDIIGKRKFIFCYFLGNDAEHKRSVKDFAINHGLIIVNLPHFLHMRFDDIGFGDIDLYNITPERFLALIANAEYVMTDSFHACIFSNIFETKYFVFDRESGINMKPRIDSILEIFDCQWRAIQAKDLISGKVDTMRIPDRTAKQIAMEEESLRFLEDIIRKASKS